MRPAPLQLPRRSRSRSTWSASSASRARAPSTTCGGAFEVNASFASRARAASRKPSASASSFSSRARSASAEAPAVPGRADQRLDLAGDDREAALRHRPVERVARQVALERPGTSESLDRRRGAPRTSGPSASARRRRRGSQLAGRHAASARALRIAADELDERADLAPRPRASRSPTPGQRATISSSGSVGACGSAPQSCLGDERHDRVEQAEVRVERLDERPPGRLADLGGQRLVGEPDLRQLEAPVAELGPDAVVQGAR